uniref:(California timema) hypothetical protein n=1 Tax=Timema californicum TaxID=61474 RepID=A0A7R9JAE3_TIMCA|nr:unnamed protein product [Timema californicum]
MYFNLNGGVCFLSAVLWNQFLINGATCLFSLELIASITLVGGAIQVDVVLAVLQKKSNLVVPWLAVNSVLCCVFLVFMVAGGLYLLGNEPWVIIVYIAASIAYFFLLTGLLLHSMVAVHRFYQQLIVNKCSTASDRTLAGMTLVPSSSVWNYYPRRATPSPPGLSQDGPSHVTMVRDEFQHTD